MRNLQNTARRGRGFGKATGPVARSTFQRAPRSIRSAHQHAEPSPILSSCTLGRFQGRIGEGSASDRSTSTPKPREEITRTPPPAAPGHWRDAAPLRWTQTRATANRKRKPPASRPQGRPLGAGLWRTGCVDGGAEEVAGRVAPDGRWYARLRNALPLRSPFGAAGCGPRRRLDIDPRPILVPDSRDSNHHQALDTRATRLLSNMKSTSIGACLLLGVVREGGGPRAPVVP